MDINQIKQARPEWSTLTDSQVVDMIHQLDYPDLTREQVAQGLGVTLEQPAQAPMPGRGAAGWAKDLGISALKGAIAVPEAAVGLADMVSGGRAGKALEEVGFRPAEAKAILDEQYTDQTKQALGNVQKAEGVMGTLGAVIDNPSVIPLAIAESAPLMGGGGAVAQGVMRVAPRVGVLAAAAAGEGVVSAGSSAEQIRQQTQDGLLTGEQAAIAGTIGALTAGLGALGGKVAKKLGISDVDTMLAQGSLDAGVRKGIVRSTLEGAAAEGLLEELPQSVQEQALQNLALGKPIDEGVDQAAVLGALTGAAMGGAAGVVARPRLPNNGPLSRGANLALDRMDVEAAQAGQPAPGLSEGQYNQAMDGIMAQGDADMKALKQAGFMDKGPSAYANVAGAPAMGAPGVDPLAQSEQPFDALADRIMATRETLADEGNRQAIREKFGQSALDEVLYYLNQADKPGQIPDQTRDNMLAMAEEIVSRSRLTPMEQPGGLGAGAYSAPERLGADVGVPQIGLDTEQTGVFRADAAGNVAPETNADRINTRQAAAAKKDRPQGGPGMDAMTPRDTMRGAGPGVMVGDGVLTPAERPARQRPAAGPVPRLVYRPNGEPFKNQRAAVLEQRRVGGDVVPVEGGWAVQTQGEADDVRSGETVGSSERTGADGAPDAVASVGSDGRSPADGGVAVDERGGASAGRDGSGVGRAGAVPDGSADRGIGEALKGKTPAFLKTKTVPEMTDEELKEAQSFYGPNHKRAKTIAKEMAKRAPKVPAVAEPALGSRLQRLKTELAHGGKVVDGILRQSNGMEIMKLDDAELAQVPADKKDASEAIKARRDALLAKDEGKARKDDQEPAARQAGEVVGEAKEVQEVQALPDSRDVTGKQASWVIREKENGEVVMETFDKKVAGSVNTEKYEAVPIAEHLASLNNSANEPSQPSQEAQDDQQVQGQASTEEVGARAADKVIGEKINDEWTAFSEESGTLGIPRDEMPQIKAEHRGALVNFLNARGIEHAQEEVDPATLKPTQAEFSPAKVEQAKAFTGGDRSILASEDSHVLDGHHQWLAKLEAGEPVKLIRLMAPIRTLLEQVKQFPSAEQDQASAQAPEQQAEQASPFSAFDAVANEYGYTVTADGLIGKGDKFPGPRIVLKGGRLRIEGGNSNLLASYAGQKPISVGKFLESFWYAKKKTPVAEDSVTGGIAGAAAGAPRSTPPGNDRDTFTLERQNKETGRMEPVKFERGEYVKVWINSSSVDFGEIDGISQAKREFSVNGLWHTMGAAYKAERPAAPVKKTEPLSKTIKKMNAKNGAGLTDADRVPETKPTSKTPTVDRHMEVMESVRNEGGSLADYQASFAAVSANEDAVKAELTVKTKEELLRAGGAYFHMRYKGETKPDIIQAFYAELLEEYALGKSYGPNSYIMTGGGMAVHRQRKREALKTLVEAQTQEDLDNFAKEIADRRAENKAEREAKQAAMANPQTLSDFRSLLNVKIREGMTRAEAFLTLTPEQRIKYDELEAESTKESREAAKRAAKTAVRSAGQTTAGEIVATKHTRDGHDLWVVKLADRLSADDYRTVLASAKRLGGSYSSFRGNGAIPGFQFRTPDAAQAFLKLAGGDTTEAQGLAEQRRDAFDDDRSQSAVERLREMADKLEERAQEALDRDRKTNTARRARFTAAADREAQETKALAQTMRNIAQAIEEGRAKFLDGVRTKSQVELLRGRVVAAKQEELRVKHPSYADQEKRKGEPATAETADFAEFPTFSAFRSDLASLARQMLEVDGTKKLGQQLMSVADDVTDAYIEFAKKPENLYKLSTFSIRHGDDVKAAIFPSKDAAERAIRRSGLSDRAIVLAEKRGVNRIIMSPSEAMSRGVWTGDGDKRITLTADAGAALVQAIGRRGNKTNRLTVPWQFQTAHDRLNALKRIGIETPSEYRSALREFIGLQERAIVNKVREMELAMAGRKNDGLDFFPTPAEVADQMVAAADIGPDMAVLEPSAGMGHIADRIREAGAEPDVIELAEDRRELLQEKGYNLADARDFLDMKPRQFFTYGDVFRAPDGSEGVMSGSGGMGSSRVILKPLLPDGSVDSRRGEWYDRDQLVGVRHRGVESGYDRIIMNPPFSNGRDIEHVMHAYDLLKPGGRIVAIMGESAFFNQSKKAEAFRQWLDDKGGTSEKLPAGSFMDTSLPVNTGVNARMVVIDKADSASSSPENLADVGFSRDAATNTEEENALKALSENDDLFRLPKSEGTTVEAITADNDPSIKVKKLQGIPGRTEYQFTMPNGKTARMVVRPSNPYGANTYGFDYVDGETSNVLDVRPGDNPEDVDPDKEDVWIDVSLLSRGQEGAKIYNIAATYAHNTDRIFIGDPAGLSDDALIRRPEQMLSSALKFGTTEHLAPHPQQITGDDRLGVPSMRWVYGDHIGNIKRLIDVNLKFAENAGVDAITFDPTDGKFRDSEGGDLGRAGIEALAVGAGYGRAVGAGADTLARGAVLRALLREESGTGKGQVGGRDGLLARLVSVSAAHDEATKRVFYSREGVSQPESGDGSRRQNAIAAIAHMDMVEDLVRQLTGGWKNAPEIVVLRSMDEAPEAVRAENARQVANGATGEPEAFYHRGKAYLLASHMRSMNDVRRAVFHEVLGHLGMRGLYGTEIGEILDQVARARRVDVEAKARQYGLNMKNARDKQIAAEEWLAEIAQENPQLGFVRRAVAAIRSWLRRNVPALAKMRMTDDEIIRELIVPVQRFIKGGPPDGGQGLIPAFRRDQGFSRGEGSRVSVKRNESGERVYAAGGVSLVYPIESERLEVIPGPGQKILNYAIMPTDSFDVLGNMEVLVENGQPVSILDINVDGRNKGVGAKAVGMLLAAHPNTDMNVSNIIPAAQGFWEKMGIPAQNREEGAAYDGTINHATYLDAQAGRGAQGILAEDQGQNRQADARAEGGSPQALGGSEVGFSRTQAAQQFTGKAREAVQDFFGSAGAQVDWLDRTFKTQYAKAQKFPAFRAVFNKLQDYIEGVSTLANEAADNAPSILPKLENWRDLAKTGLKESDAKAVAAPIFEGTLSWARVRGQLVPMDEAVSQGFDGEAGVVFTDKELREQFKLTDEQIGYYREFRAAVDESLDQLVSTEVIRLLGDAPPAVKAMAMTREGRAGLRGAISAAFDNQDDPLLKQINDKFDHINRMKARGYAPLSRFGKFWVHVVDQDGQTQYFGMAETRTEANRLARNLREEFPGAAVEQGVMSQEFHKLMSAVPVDAMELFASAIGADQSEVFQKYIQLAKNNRSTMKRLIKRKGTSGFSDDVPRVLASFVTSNARAASTALNIKDAKDLARDIRDGDVKDEAIKLIESVTEPEESGAAIRSVMFTNFIGGSIASAVVNVTQPFMMTLPYLSQWGGALKAGGRLVDAARMIATGVDDSSEIGNALKRAELEGVVSPQEIHHLIDRAAGGIGSKHLFWKKVALLWSGPFSIAEQFNRRVSFLAAYQTAKAEGIANPFGFAEKAVIETQGLYNAGNKPNVARGAIGATAMTFKQYSIHYLEWLARMAKSGPDGKKAAALALVLLMMAAGTDGLPFMDDMDDVFDTVGQAMGYDTNTKRARREAVASVLGEELAEVATRGFSAAAGFPVDLSVRIGMGNLLPATDLLLKSNTDTARSLAEIAGPGGALFTQYRDAARELLGGDLAGAIQKASPVALQNLMKAAKMAETGEYRDQRDRKVTDVDGLDVGMKALSFQPAQIARESTRMAEARQSETLAKAVENEITDKWARAIADGDREAEKEALKMRDDWNEKNPEQPIVVKRSQAVRKARNMKMERRDRFLKTVSPERRALVDKEIS